MALILILMVNAPMSVRTPSSIRQFADFPENCPPVDLFQKPQPYVNGQRASNRITPLGVTFYREPCTYIAK